MRRITILPVLMLVLVAAKDDPLAGRTAAAPVDCIDSDDASGIRITDAGSIIYQRTDRQLWVTSPIGRCPALRPLTTLIVERFGAQLCRGDRFRVVEAPSSIPSAYCRFGPFVPWKKTPSPPARPQ